MALILDNNHSLCHIDFMFIKSRPIIQSYHRCYRNFNKEIASVYVKYGNCYYR